MKLNIKKDWLITLIIIGLALFFRIFKLEELFPFTMDEEYQAFIVERIVKGTHFPLIGVNIADTGLYLGSFFSYFSALIFFLSKKTIIGWAASSAVIGTITTLCLIRLGQKFIGKIEGFLAGILYATSFLAVSYDRKFWNPSLVPLLSILLVWSIGNLKEKPKYWLFVFLGLGLIFHIHLSLFLFLPALIWWILKDKVKIKKNHWFLLGTGLFLVCLVPLILFDLRHNFLQTKAGINLIKVKTPRASLKQKTPTLLKTSARLIIIPGDHNLAKEINVCKDLKKTTPFLGFGLLIPASIVFLIKQKLNKKKRIFLKLLTGIFVAFTGGFLFFPLEPSEYYLLPLFPLSFLILAWAIEAIIAKKGKFTKTATIIFLAIVLVFNTLSNLDSKNSFGLKTKKQVVAWAIKRVGGRPYFLDAIGNCYKYEGYRYLFEKLGQAPVASFMDSQFSWLYQDEDKRQVINYEKTVVIFNNTPEISEKERKTWEEEIMGVAHEKITGDFGLIKVLIKSK